MNESERLPLIVNINQNSLDDGPGIRSVIFFKGCPLSCVWCQNPEAQHTYPEMIFQPGNCINCQPCTVSCPNGAFTYEQPLRLERKLCNRSFKCITQCPADVFKKAGEYYEISDLVSLIKSNKVFYDNTGGGVTLSGGEPLMFPNYTKNLINNLKLEGISTLLETCGFFKITKDIEQILTNVDIIYYDIKIFDLALHRKYCGVDNKIILENFHTLITKYDMILPTEKESLNIKERQFDNPLIIPRIPLVPGITMTKTNLTHISDFLKQNNVKLMDLLPYNPLWIDKSKSLGILPAYSNESWLKPEELNQVRAFFSDFNYISFK